MDFRHPVESVIPGAQGKVLAILAETTGELNLRTIARLARVSPAQASRVLPTLVRLGLVERREAPPSALFSFVDEHVAARAVRALSRSRDAVLDELGDLSAKIHPRPVSAVVFGSFARGEADDESDLDIVLVRPDDGDDDAWTASLETFRTAARRLTGNRVQVLEVFEPDARRKLRSMAPVWVDVVRDGVVVFGTSIEDLRGGRRA